MTKTTAIFGQGPNETGWRRWVRRFNGNVWRAEAEAARVAITGECGELLAGLLDEHPLKFYGSHYRFNLNARWNGKSYGTDAFDKIEAYWTSQRILAEHPEIERVVCLGRNVGMVMGFGARDPMLTVMFTSDSKCRSYLLFPHPSGRNHFWNDPLNRRNAARRLKKFLQEQTRKEPTNMTAKGEAALEAIDALFGDTSVSKRVTLDDLEEIQSDLETKIDALETDIENEEKAGTDG
jgi:hypothetical protein